MTILTFDTAQVAATPQHDCGKWSYTVPEERAPEIRKALENLGFTVQERSMATMTEDEFDKRFTVIESAGNGSYHERVPEGVPPERVWTAVDGDDGGIYLLPGYHIVNKVDYVITEEPWDDTIEEVEWFIPEDEEEDGAPREQWETTDPFQHAEADTRDKHDPTL